MGTASPHKLIRTKPVLLVYVTLREFGRDDCSHMAAGIAYFALFSIFPLLLIALTVASTFAAETGLRDQIVAFVTAYLPSSHSIVVRTIEGVVAARGSVGALAAVGLLWSGSAVFTAIRRSINRAWGSEGTPSFWRQKARELGMMAGAAVLLVLSFATTALYRTASNLQIPLAGSTLGDNGLWRTAGLLIPLGFTFAVFALVFRFMPSAKVEWGDVWPGAVFSAVAFESAKHGFVWYVENLASYNLVYGPLAGVVVLLLWAYVCALILLLGAEFTSEYAHLYRHRDGRRAELGTG